MSSDARNGTSRSLAIYRWLLEFYPRAYLRQHREEMLQNFHDLEQASPSKSALWLLIGRDLLASLQTQFTRTLWGQTAMVVLVLAIVLAYAQRHADARRLPTEACCFGYILGWFAGWMGKQWQASPVSWAPDYIRSLPGQATIVVGVLSLAVALTGASSRTHTHVLIWSLCYGFLLAWGVGWLGNRRQMRL